MIKETVTVAVTRYFDKTGRKITREEYEKIQRGGDKKKKAPARDAQKED